MDYSKLDQFEDLEKSIETKDMIYTIEEIKDKHITVVKATKIEKNISGKIDLIAPIDIPFLYSNGKIFSFS